MNWPTPSNAAVVVGLGGANADKLAPPPRAADDALILQAQAGDRRAWGALVDRHLNAITGYAWYMLGDQGDAEDVAQETFLRLMGKVGTWQPDGGASLKTWLSGSPSICASIVVASACRCRLNICRRSMRPR